MATFYSNTLKPGTSAAEANIDARPSEVIRPSWQELLALCVVNLLYMVGLVEGQGFMETMNLVGPTLLMITMALAAVLQVKRGVVAIWAPLFWARVALAVYYGVGSLVPYFVNTDTRDMMEAFYFSFPRDVAQYNLVGGLFALFMLLSALLFSQMLDARKTDSADTIFGWKPHAAGPGLKNMALLLLIVGSAVDYGLILPSSIGLITTPIPQALSQVAFASWLGCFLLTYSSLRDKSPLLYLAIAASILSCASGILQFSKQTAVFPLLMLAMGFVYARPRLKNLVVSFLAIGTFFMTIVPVVTYSRAVLVNTLGTGAAASLPDRLKIVMSYTAEREKEINDKEVQGGWARLSYVNSGTFAINQFDAGRPGASLRNIFIVFLPRFIYPNKPIITDIGNEFNASVNGNAGSASSPGLAAELYWNGGWPMLIFGSLLVGIILSALSAYSVVVMRNEAFHLLFIVLIGLRMGVRMDGMMVPDIIGPISYVVIGHVVLNALNNLSLKK
ncbi:MAG: hypothetical protein ABI240_04945 [Sphingomonas sp.]